MTERKEPWQVVRDVRRLIADKYPEFRVGKLELWDLGGTTVWKSSKTKKQWLKELRDEREPAQEDRTCE